MSDSPIAIGVDLGGTKIEALALDAHGRELWRRRVPTPAGDYAGTLSAIGALVGAARTELAARSITLGIGTPGSLAHDGRLKNSNSTCLNGMPLAADLERELGARVRIANDADCLALSEATDGAGAGANTVFAVILGTGVGGGIAVRGTVLHGPNGLSGEWGHNPLPWREAGEDSELECYCGARGCIETLLSGTGLARDHAARTGSSSSAAEIAVAAEAGDADARASLARYESRLARALAAVINLLDPDVIVLGGGVSRIERLYENVPRLWSAHVFCAGVPTQVRTPLRQSQHGDSSGVRGAAWLGRSA
ncbi:MAG: ROK family protein [Planctomycetes bacterium]|nr:ROK family protein [Planctomycetota bacterium]